jgi:hypothetical protein
MRQADYYDVLNIPQARIAAQFQLELKAAEGGKLAYILPYGRPPNLLIDSLLSRNISNTV